MEMIALQLPGDRIVAKIATREEWVEDEQPGVLGDAVYRSRRGALLVFRLHQAAGARWNLKNEVWREVGGGGRYAERVPLESFDR